ncbi:MAG: hypothetical protein WD877_02265 [Candidatus Saccharimonadales bacterium]
MELVSPAASEIGLRTKPVELIRKIIRNPGFLLRAPERIKDISRWRQVYEIIDEYSDAHPGLTFLQIGANDGVRSDPVH